MSTPRPIGILGGMGPEATVLLQQRLIDRVPAQDDADHIPLLIDMNPQVPSRIAHLIEGRGPDPGPALAEMAMRLEAAGAIALAMPCNTAHHYASFIKGAVRIPFLDMVEIAADYAFDSLGPGASIGMLASPAVQKTRLFNQSLEARGLSVLWPKDQDAMLAGIRAIKIHGPCESARDVLAAASSELVEAGAALQLVACSEFSIIGNSVAPDSNAVDTIDLLTDAIIAASTA